MSDQDVNDQPFNGEGQGGQQPLSPGAKLATCREERGWTIEQVASQLNLAPRQVIAIEHDDYASLPGTAVTRGFVRAYAKLLQIDPAPLLTALGGETVLMHDAIGARKTLSTPFSETRLPSMSDRSGLSSKWIVWLLLIVLVGVAIWAVQRRADFSRVSSPARSPAVVVPLPKPETAPAPAPAPAPEVAPGQSPANEQPQAPVPREQSTSDLGKTASSPATSDAAPAAITPLAGEAQPAMKQPAEDKTAPGKDELVLHASQDSWVEIRRTGNNAIVLSRVMKAGETETVQVSEPISLVIGNAAGVDATLRGTPVDLKRGPKNVARLKLK